MLLIKKMEVAKISIQAEPLTRNYPGPFYREPAPVVTKRHVVETPYSILCITLIFKVNESIAYNRYIDREIEQWLPGFPLPPPQLLVHNTT